MSRKLTPEEAEQRRIRRNADNRRRTKKKYAEDATFREMLKRKSRQWREANREAFLENKREYYIQKREVFLAKFKLRYRHRNQYRALAEQSIGRTLEKNEHVHHIDCDHENNAIENLDVLTVSQHARAHTSLNALAKGLIADGIIEYDRESKLYRRVQKDA